MSVAPLGAPVVPLVNWMLIGSSNWSRSASSASRARCGAGAEGRDLGERDGAGRVAADLDHGLERGQPALPAAGPGGGGELGRQLAQHGEIVAGLEAGGR